MHPDSLQKIPVLISIIVTIVLLLTGCIERISTNTAGGGGQLVVEGKITNGNGPFTVSIGRTSDKNQVMVPVDGAKVIIFDDSTHQNETYRESVKGTYELKGNIVKGTPGHAYHIEVVLPDGSIYRSRPEIMPGLATTDSAYYKLGTRTVLNKYGIPVKDKVVRVYVDTHIPDSNKNIYLRWYTSEVYIFKQYRSPGPLAPPPVYCFITAYPNPQEIFLYDGEKMHAGNITGKLMATRSVDYSFFFRHFFNIHVVSITRDAFTYWNHVDEVVNSAGTIFDVPPSTVIGNIYNPKDSKEQVLGYFEAAAVDTARIGLSRSDFPYPIEDPCPTPDQHLGCASCLNIQNSTLTEPYYFE